MQMITLLLIQSLILFGTGDPDANTASPTGLLKDSGWQLEGQWGVFLATPIGPHSFLAAAHVGGSVGDIFYFDGKSYTTTKVQRPPSQSDLLVWTVAEKFPRWAGLYVNGDELGKAVVMIGRGTQRGQEMWKEGIQRPHSVSNLRVEGSPVTSYLSWAASSTNFYGWAWGPGDGRMRWGTNVLIMGDNNKYCTSFVPSGRDTCQATVGDSSGAAFVFDTGDSTWKLAGIISAVSGIGPYSEKANGPLLKSVFLRQGGLYYLDMKMTGGEGSRTYITRVFPDSNWILQTIGQP